MPIGASMPSPSTIARSIFNRGIMIRFALTPGKADWLRLEDGAGSVGLPGGPGVPSVPGVPATGALGLCEATAIGDAERTGAGIPPLRAIDKPAEARTMTAIAPTARIARRLRDVHSDRSDPPDLRRRPEGSVMGSDYAEPISDARRAPRHGCT